MAKIKKGDRMETVEITQALLKTWRAPPFQRALKINTKLREIADEIKDDGGVLPGVITIGILDGLEYVVDGQHRLHGFLITGLEAGYADVRYHTFDTMAQMAEEFVNLNSKIATLRPDDVLRGIEAGTPILARIRRECPFVGYAHVRQGKVTMSMSAALRMWFASASDTPSSKGIAATALAERITDDEADGLIAFLKLCLRAWGSDREYHRLWAQLNLTMCAWVYRRIVLDEKRTNFTTRRSKVSEDDFCRALMGLSASEPYLDWLQGRSLGDTSRSPCYARIRQIFATRLESATGKKPILPGADWAASGGSVRV